MSLSIYRGQSRTGQGEGPGQTVLHGEQFLRVDPALYRTELLEAIRPWMTLDSDPSDHQRLNDKLEAWSLFGAGDSLFVVRLVSAGVYDRRAAYFAHGRAWRSADLSPGVDPGLHLGRSEVFDAPWRDDQLATPAIETSPFLVRPEQVAAEQKTAAIFLGHLLQALTSETPLIVAAPVADFTIGGALHALIGFCRGGLPATVRRDCRIRVYSRFPDLFLRHLGANLVVIPEDAATAALTARPNATLLDRQGRRLAGKELGAAAERYANAVVERAIGIPEGLSLFTERIAQRAPDDPREVQIAYNLAFALAGPAERRGELLRRYLPRAADKLGPGLDWRRLIGPDEWQKFPAEAVMEQLLTSSPATEGRREFLAALQDGAARLGLHVDERLAEWWDAGDDGKVRRLLELFDHKPSLVSAAAVTERSRQVPIARLAQSGLAPVAIDLEAQCGRLAERNRESSDLAGAANDSSIFKALSRATSENRLSAAWAQEHVRAANDAALYGAAQVWLRNERFFAGAWGEVPRLLVERLRSLDAPPRDLAPLLCRAGEAVQPDADPETFLALSEALTRIDAEQGKALLRRLWTALSRITPPGREFLERAAFRREWRCLDIRSLELTALLQLAGLFESDTHDTGLFEELDRRMAADPEETTKALVREEWWFFWRRNSQLRDAEVLTRSAFAWLSSPVWAEGKEATLEAWKQVMRDLPRTLSGPEGASLRSGMGRRAWPSIPPFEEEQLKELIERVADLGALAEIAEGVAGEWTAEQVLAMSSLRDILPEGALRWLVDARSGSPPPLGLEQSAWLHSRAGHRAGRALQARVASVVRLLDADATTALKAADRPDLWSNREFLTAIAEWMNGRGSVQAIGTGVAKRINDRVNGEADGVHAPSRELVRELMEKGCDRAARLLHPQYQGHLEMEKWSDVAIDALLRRSWQHDCWQRLASMLQVRRDEHPLLALAGRIGTREFSIEDRRALARDGWRTFVAAGSRNTALVTPLLATPHPEAELLPLLALSAQLLGPGALGSAVLQLVYSAGNPAWREDNRLWRSVLRALRAFRRHGAVASADDREDVALALVYECLEQRKERSALSTALRTDTHPISIEFGESRHE